MLADDRQIGSRPHGLMSWTWVQSNETIGPMFIMMSGAPRKCGRAQDVCHSPCRAGSGPLWKGWQEKAYIA